MADKAIHARLVVHNFPGMSKEERKCLIQWMERQLSYLKSDDPYVYSEKYTARLFK